MRLSLTLLLLGLASTSVVSFLGTKGPALGLPVRPVAPGLGARGGRAAVMMMSDLDRAAKLRAEAEKLEQELGTLMASRPKPVATEERPAPVARYLPPDQIKAEVGKVLSGGSVAAAAALKQLKDTGVLNKFESASAKGFRRYSAEQFEQVTGFPPQDVESGGTQDDLKWALGAVMAASTLAVFGGSFIGGFAGSLLVYLFLLIPITFIGIGSVAPGLISVGVVLVNNLLDGQQKERKVTHQAARFLTGYLLGLPIESAKQGDEVTYVKFFDTIDGNFNELGASSPSGPGPDARKKFGQDDILPNAVLAITGSVAERLEFGKVIDRQADFLYLVALMDIVRPSLRGGQKNDLVLYSALQAHKILTANKSKLEEVKAKIAAKAPLEELVATMESY